MSKLFLKIVLFLIGFLSVLSTNVGAVVGVKKCIVRKDCPDKKCCWGDGTCGACKAWSS